MESVPFAMVLNCKGLIASNPQAVVALVRGEAVVILMEVWTADAVVIHGYTAFHRARRWRGGAHRGGITVYIRNDLCAFATAWDFGNDDSDRYLWLRIDRDAGISDQDLYIAGCYFEPGGGLTELARLGDDIAQATGLGMVMVAGDFNAHTKQKGGGTERWSEDAQRPLNAAGKLILEIAAATGVLIANGSVAGHTSGNHTFWNTSNHKSVTDYIMLCPHLLRLACNLQVEGPPPHERLDHCAMRLDLRRSASGPAPPPPPAIPALMMAAPRRLTLPGDKRGEYITAIRAAAAGIQTAADAADAAHSPTAVAAALQQISAVINASAVAAGAYSSKTSHSQRMDPRQALEQRVAGSTAVKHLVRQRRLAHRHGDGQRCRQLDRQLCNLKQSLRRRARIDSQYKLLAEWKQTPAAVWRELKAVDQSGTQHSPAETLAYCEQLLGGNTGISTLPAVGQLPASICGDGAELSTPLTAGEVEVAIAAAKTGKAVSGSLTLTLLKPVAAELAPALAAVFNAVARAKEMPADMALGVITMVPKPRALTTTLDDHRSITVCTLLDKIYSSCHARRLDDWGEGLHLRAKSQTGFRRDHRTTDNVLVMRALVDRYRYEKKPLYAAFVDFKKAYDTVPLARMWEKLSRRGVPPSCIDALRAQYSKALISVKTTSGLTQPFQLTKGLKQGEPTSCGLFGLYIDDLPPAITDLGGAAALPVLDGQPVEPPLHADDLALTSESTEGLQAQLDALLIYANANDLTVSLKKTKVMILSSHGAQQELRISYNGQRVAQVSEFTYLGTLFTETGDGDSAAGAARLGLAKGAWAGVRRKAAALGITSVKLLLRFFDAVVVPTLESGVELWGAGYAAAAAGADGYGPAEVFHRDTIKHLLGVNGSVANVVALAEVGRYPLKCRWGRAVYKFWTRVVTLQDSRAALGAAVRDNMQLAGVGASCWAKNVMNLGARVGVHVGLDSGAALPPKLVEAAMQQQYLEVFRGAAGTKIMFYKNVVRGGATSRADYTMQPYVYKVLATTKRAALAQLRCSAHRLGVEVARWLPGRQLGGGDDGGPAGGGGRGLRRRRAGRVDNTNSGEAGNSSNNDGGDGASGSGGGGGSSGDSQASGSGGGGGNNTGVRAVAAGMCRLCGGDAVEDEAHMVFHCGHAPLGSVRAVYADLFQTTSTVVSDFLLQDPNRLAAFVHECFVAGQYDSLPHYGAG